MLATLLRTLRTQSIPLTRLLTTKTKQKVIKITHKNADWFFDKLEGKHTKRHTHSQKKEKTDHSMHEDTKNTPKDSYMKPKQIIHKRHIPHNRPKEPKSILFVNKGKRSINDAEKEEKYKERKKIEERVKDEMNEGDIQRVERELLMDEINTETKIVDKNESSSYRVIQTKPLHKGDKKITKSPKEAKVHNTKPLSKSSSKESKRVEKSVEKVRKTKVLKKKSVEKEAKDKLPTQSLPLKNIDEGELKEERPPESQPLSINPSKKELRSKIPEVLLEAIRSPEYRQQAGPQILIHVLRSLAYHTRSQPFIKERPEITDTLSYLTKSLELLDTQSLTVLVSLLVTNTIKDQKIWAPIVGEVLKRRKEFTLEEIAFIILSMKNSNKFLSVVMNNDGFFYEMEEEVILKLDERFEGSEVEKIVKAYTETENGSIDFYRLIEKKLVEHNESLKKEHLSKILYHLSKAPNCDDELFKDFRKRVGTLIKEHKFTPEELCKILKAFNGRKLLDKELLQAAESGLLLKYEIFTVAEIATMYNIFMLNKEKYNPVKGWKYINECIEKLYKALEINGVADLFEGWNGINCPLLPQVKGKIKEQVLRLIKTKDKVSKQALVQVYNITKEEPMPEGQYNTFAEKIYMQIRDYI